MDVLGFSNWDYAKLRLISFIGIFFGSLVFKCASQLLGIRAMLVIACVVNFIGALGQLFFVKGIMFGIDPFIFISMVNFFTDTVAFAFENMSALTLLAKIIPPKVEASMFSLMGGVLNLSYWFAARMLGNLVNVFFGVKEDDLTDFWKLFLVQCICALLPIAFIWLIPVQAEIEEI